MERPRQLAAVLRHAEVLHLLPEDVLAALAAAAETSSCCAGTLLTGDEPGVEHIWVVMRGSVRLKLVSADGEELVLHDISAGSLFRVGPSGESLEETAGEVLANGTVIAAIAERPFMDAVGQHPAALGELLTLQRRHSRRFHHMVAELAFCCVEVRLAHKLAELAGPDADSTVRASHADLARMIGSTRQQVSAHLEHFRHLGLMTYRRQGPRATEITVHDAAALATYTRSTH
jgi:CRP-like cAMP-binding protein